MWIEHSGYTGNLVGGIISGEDVHGLQRLLERSPSKPHEPNSGPLYTPMGCATPAGITSSFDASSLLETIARYAWFGPIHRSPTQQESTAHYPEETGTTHTPKQPGKTYALLMHLAATTPQSPISFTTKRPSSKCRCRGPVMG